MTAATLTAHPEYLALLRDVLERPHDDAPRLLLADWWEDHGASERAEFVRVQVELASGRLDECTCRLDAALNTIRDPDCPHVRRDALRRREGVLLRRGQVAGGFLPPAPPWLAWAYRRGFVWSVTVRQNDFLRHAAALFAAHPVTSVGMHDRQPWRDGDGRWHWVEGDDEVAWRGPLVSSALYARMPGGGARESREGAIAALSATCVGHGRALAGLPPLP